jgi:hypothetical protein
MLQLSISCIVYFSSVTRALLFIIEMKTKLCEI